MRHCAYIGIAMALTLSACASISPKVGNVTGSATVNLGTPAPVIITKTIVQTCLPPPDFLQKYDPRPKITEKHLSPKDLVLIDLSDVGAYEALRADHSHLIDWIEAYCARPAH